MTMPVLGFAAFSGTGKTTLLKKLIPELAAKGINIAIVKHAHHSFDVDHPGKDSYELRKAGARQILISSSKRSVKIVEQTQEKTLQQCLAEIDAHQSDLILVEGFKHASISKIELYRPSLGRPALYLQDKNIIAVACDDATQLDADLPILDLNNTQQIVDYICQNLDQFTQTNAS